MDLKDTGYEDVNRIHVAQIIAQPQVREEFNETLGIL
jgi:hypothetical protein